MLWGGGVVDGAEAEGVVESEGAVVEPAEVEEGELVVPPGAGVVEEDESGGGVEDGGAEVLDCPSSEDVESADEELELWAGGGDGVEDAGGGLLGLGEPVKSFRAPERESARRINPRW